MAIYHKHIFFLFLYLAWLC